jgi:hypothetical protein
VIQAVQYSESTFAEMHRVVCREIAKKSFSIEPSIWPREEHAWFWPFDESDNIGFQAAQLDAFPR